MLLQTHAPEKGKRSRKKEEKGKACMHGPFGHHRPSGSIPSISCAQVRLGPLARFAPPGALPAADLPRRAAVSRCPFALFGTAMTGYPPGRRLSP